MDLGGDFADFGDLGPIWVVIFRDFCDLGVILVLILLISLIWR